MRQDDVGKLLNTVQAIADETTAPIAAVFVDTVSRVLPGSDENLQKDMTDFVAACDAVRRALALPSLASTTPHDAGDIAAPR